MEAFHIILIGAFLMFILERLIPHVELANTKYWWPRVITFNLLQFLISAVGFHTWERWVMDTTSTFNMKEYYSPIVCGILAYLINTWLFYWWHVVRHNSYWMWNSIHQFHHSPERIEVATSFYKHPFEIMMNSVIITILLYPVLGLSHEASAWFTVFSAFGEFFYHMNIRTPHWIGYFVQRPESHCLHHIRDKRFCRNYADFPIWDILGGTFYNPTEEEFKTIPIGFSEDKETKVMEMMKCKNVVPEKIKETDKTSVNFVIFLFLLSIGCMSTIGYMRDNQTIRGLGFASAASPLPLVFSAFNGVETFSTTYDLNVGYKNGTNINLIMDNKLYSKLQGPYNRKNMFGVMFSHGPFFNQENQIKMRDQTLKWGLCEPGDLVKEFGLGGEVKYMDIIVRSKTKGNENKRWVVVVNCN